MTEHDERIEELLAGFALGSLDRADEAEAEVALAEHVPSCAVCRGLLADFQSVAGELALAAAPSEPSAMLEARVRRSIDGAPSRRWSRGRALLAGSAAVLVLVLGATTAMLATQVSEAEGFQNALAAGYETLADPRSESVDMAPDSEQVYLFVTYVPGTDEMVLMGTNLPAPEEGEVYRLWGLDGESSTLLTEFVPDDDGLVAIELTGNVEAYDHLVCDTVEQGEEPSQAPGPTIWGGPVEEQVTS
jgi:hypothetical protein